MTDAQTLFSFKFLQKTNQVTLTSPKKKKNVFIVTNARNANRVNRIKSSKGGEKICVCQDSDDEVTGWYDEIIHPVYGCVCGVHSLFFLPHPLRNVWGKNQNMSSVSPSASSHTIIVLIITTVKLSGNVV